MGMTIREKADVVGSLRWVSVFAMETLARWIPTSPEFEAKTCFGRHVWELAQHADALGRRTAELRAALHFSNPPTPAYRALLEELAASSTTPARVATFYDGLCQDLPRRYMAYLSATDRLLDDPSVRVMERILPDFTRMRDEAGAMLRQRPDLAGASALGADWATRAGAVTDWVSRRPVAATPEVLA